MTRGRPRAAARLADTVLALELAGRARPCAALAALGGVALALEFARRAALGAVLIHGGRGTWHSIPLMTALRSFVTGQAPVRAPPSLSEESRQRVLVNLRRCHPHTLAALDAVRECAMCGNPYEERGNLGQWLCFYHPGQRIDGVWTCCGGRALLVGCRAADHALASRSGRPPAVARVPAFVEATPPRREAVLAGAPAGGWVVEAVRSRADVQDVADERSYDAWEERNHQLVLRCDAFTMAALPLVRPGDS